MTDTRQHIADHLRTAAASLLAEEKAKPGEDQAKDVVARKISQVLEHLADLIEGTGADGEGESGAGGQ